LFASASTPVSQLDFMHHALERALALPAIANKLRDNGLEPLHLTRAQTDARVREDTVFMKDFLAKVPVDFST
jgi:tripartite-type tricarboxylate transporter receptor subunit TctC